MGQLIGEQVRKQPVQGMLQRHQHQLAPAWAVAGNRQAGRFLAARGTESLASPGPAPGGTRQEATSAAAFRALLCYNANLTITSYRLDLQQA